MGDRKQKAWELPFSFTDPIMGIDMTVDRYDLDSGGSGVQVTFSGGVGPIAVRVPMERAVLLAMRILAEAQTARRKARE